MKKVLLITYYWPPAGGGGVQRIAKFAKYLPAFGWQPVVLTVEGGNFPDADSSLTKDVAAAEHVFRVHSLEPHSIYRRLRGLGSNSSHKTDPALSGHSFIAELIRLNLFIPDSRIGWRAPAVRKALEIVSDLQPSMILSSAPPYTAHLIALTLKNKCRIPWVADFRDPWVENFTYNTVPRLPPVKMINKRMEARVIKNADRIVSVGEQLDSLLRSKAPHSDTDKFAVINNGFDPEDIPSIQRERSPYFTIGYYGTMYPQGFPHVLFEAFSDLRTEKPDIIKNMKVRLTGKIDAGLYKRFQEVVPSSGLTHTPYIPHMEMLQEAHKEQLLLLIINKVPHDKLIITGKLFDYLPTSNPVLAIGPENGDAARIIKNTECGSIHGPDDRNGIKKAICEAYDNWKKGRLLRHHRSIAGYSRIKQAEQMAHIFELLSN